MAEAWLPSSRSTLDFLPRSGVDCFSICPHYRRRCCLIIWVRGSERADMIKIEKVQNGYLAHLTPPRVQEEWKNPTPLSRSEFVEQLRSRGVHATGIAVAFNEADPNWLQSTNR
jgi:hypothetical protein